jgi:Rieske Fe-S protein
MEAHGSPHQPLTPPGSRRSFFGALLSVGGATVGALLGIPIVRYIFYPVGAATEGAGWTVVGPVAGLASGTTPVRRTLDLTASQPVIYVINKGGALVALSAICPHLGCTVPWDPARNEFVCPCHGGTFAADGTRISGPPRRALDSLETKESGGQLLVKYQYFRPDVTNKEITG